MELLDPLAILNIGLFSLDVFSEIPIAENHKKALCNQYRIQICHYVPVLSMTIVLTFFSLSHSAIEKRS